jgi:AAA domain/UvrD-like helicase C-terminal domain
MAFLIPDNLRSRQDVPASIRRVATALQLGLDDVATVWYERLFDAADQRPDFVALLPDNGIAVLEVIDVKTGSLLGVLRGRMRLEQDGREVEVEPPLVRAERFARVLRERISAESRLAEATVPVAALALFPNLSRSEAHKLGGLDAGRFIFQEELETARSGGSGNEFERRLARALGVATPIEGTVAALVRGVIQPDLVISGADGGGQLAIFAAPEGEEVVRTLDRQQEAVAKSMGEGHRVVRGVAGSGKTLILVYRAKLFAELHPRQKFLLTCYTRALASELRALLNDFGNVEVRTVQALVQRAIREAGLEDPGFGADESGEQRAAVGLTALDRGALPRYRGVFIDEAQDLGTNALRFAVSLADGRFNDVLVVADAAQNVFRRQFNWKQAGIHAQGRSRLLRRNYRNTREILEFAYAFLTSGQEDPAVVDLEDESALVPPEAALRSGPPPSLVFCDGSELVSRAVRNAVQLLEGRQTPKKLALLTIDRRETTGLRKELEKAKVEFFLVADNSSKDRFAEVNEASVLATVYSAKGMEFPNVVLCCTPREGMDGEELRSAIYVGMTRATENLIVLVEKDHVFAPEFAAAAEGRARIDDC